jgi:translation initiation factor 2B subunit (eIF-2B alpha/beta/delta family)
MNSLVDQCYSVGAMQESILQQIDMLLKVLDSAQQKITTNVRDLLKQDGCVLVHSLSGTVVAALSASERALKVS